MICNLAVYITDLSLVDEAVSIVNYETFQSLSIIRPLHFLYSLQLIRCTNILQSRSSLPTYCSYTCDQTRLSPWRMHLHQRAIINFSPDTAIKYQTLCSALPLPKPLSNTILSQLHLPLSPKSYLPNIQLRQESPTSGPPYCARPYL
jgi:hypothetical protein